MDVASMRRQFVRREVKRQEEAGARDAVEARAEKMIQNTQSSVARYVSTRQARRAVRRDSTNLREREHPVCGHRERTYAMLANYETMIRDSPGDPTIREQWDSRLYFKICKQSSSLRLHVDADHPTAIVFIKLSVKVFVNKSLKGAF